MFSFDDSAYEKIRNFIDSNGQSARERKIRKYQTGSVCSFDGTLRTLTDLIIMERKTGDQMHNLQKCNAHTSEDWRRM